MVTPSRTRRRLRCWLGSLVACSAVGADPALAQGANLVRNPGFERSSCDPARPRGWYPIPGPRIALGEGATVLRADEEQARSGTCSALIRSAGGAARGSSYWSQIVPVKGGARYRLSGYVQACGCGRTGIGFQLLDRLGTRLGEHQLGGPRDSAGAWQKLGESFQVPLQAAELKLRCGLSGGGEVRYDDLALVELIEPRRRPFERGTYACCSIGTAVQVDGRLDEWGALERAAIPSSRAPRDLAASWQGCYDQRYLYLAVRVADDHFPCVRQPYFQGDSLRLGFDPRGQRGRKPDGDDLVIGFAPRGDGLAFFQDHPTWRAVEGGSVRRALARSGEGAIYELAIPWRLLGIRNPDRLGELAFSLVVNDEDGSGCKRLSWGGGLAAEIDPRRFGALILLPAGDAPSIRLAPQRLEVADGGVASLDLRVAARAARGELRAKVVLGEGAGELRQERRFDVPRGVTSIPFVFDLAGLAPGRWTAAATLIDDAGRALGTSRAVIQIAPYRARLDRIEERAGILAGETARLRALCGRAGAAGGNTQRAEITLAIAEHLRSFALYDAHLLPFQELAAREMEDLIAIVREALAELRRGAPRGPRLEEPDLRGLRVGAGGQFYAGERPVFLAGIVDQPLDAALTLPFLKKIGVNLVGLWTDMRLCAGGEEGFDCRRPLAALAAACEIAGRFNCRADLLLGHSLNQLKWLRARHPDLCNARGHFIEYDIDHPAARETWRRYLRVLAPQLANHPELLSCDLANEPKFPRGSKYTAQGYRSWLRGRYGTIGALNHRWGTGYASFDACAPRRPVRSQSRAAWYDWCLYNRIRVASFFGELAETIHGEAPELLLHIKVVGEDMFFPGTQDGGMDREMLAPLTAVQGTDLRPIPRAWWTPFSASIDWLGSNLALDYMKSIQPAKPIFDSEWHALQTVRYRGGEAIAPEHIETALWLAHLHGLSASLTWYWARQSGPEHRTWGDFAKMFRGSLLVQPRIVNAFAQSLLALQEHAREVIAFPAARRPLRFYFSRASAIQDPRFCSGLWVAYGAANFLARGLGFLSDRQIAAREFGDCQVLVVCGARFVPDEVVAGLRAFAARGKMVILLGEGNLGRDPWGRARAEASLVGPRVRAVATWMPSGAGGGDRRAAADAAGRSCQGELERLIARLLPLPAGALVGADGRPAWGVETRTLARNGAHLTYAINLTAAPIALRLARPGGSIEWLYGHAPGLVLAPRRPVLLRVSSD